MPTPAHQIPLALIQRDPSLVTWLLTDIAGQPDPGATNIEFVDSESWPTLTQSVQADAVVLMSNSLGDPLLAIVIEIQLRWDRHKLTTWPMYVANVGYALTTETMALVYCPKPTTAARYRRDFEKLASRPAGRVQLEPLIITSDDIPRIEDPIVAARSPGRAIWGVLAHAHEPDIDRVFPALFELLATTESDLLGYYELICLCFTSETANRWSAYMTKTQERTGKRFLSDEFNNFVADCEAQGYARGEAQGYARGEAQGYARGEALGEARGEARAILAVLTARSVDIPSDARTQILAATDLALLDMWLSRSATATTIDDVL